MLEQKNAFSEENVIGCCCTLEGLAVSGLCTNLDIKQSTHRKLKNYCVSKLSLCTKRNFYYESKIMFV